LTVRCYGDTLLSVAKSLTNGRVQCSDRREAFVLLYREGCERPARIYAAFAADARVVVPTARA